jgi:hypothetical protein
VVFGGEGGVFIGNIQYKLFCVLCVCFFWYLGIFIFYFFGEKLYGILNFNFFIILFETFEILHISLGFLN